MGSPPTPPHPTPTPTLTGLVFSRLWWIWGKSTLFQTAALHHIRLWLVCFQDHRVRSGKKKASLFTALNRHVNRDGAENAVVSTAAGFLFPK